MSDLWTELTADRALVKKYTEELFPAGKKFAEAERDYQVAKHKRVLQLRGLGKAVGEVEMIIKGDEEVKDLMFARDCAKTNYEATKEAINTYKLDARLIESQLQREWTQSGEEF